MKYKIALGVLTVLTLSLIAGELTASAAVSSVVPPPSPPSVNPSKDSISVDQFLDQTIAPGSGFITGTVIDDNTGIGISGAHVTVQELKLSATTDSNGNFKFGPIDVTGAPNGELDVTLVSQTPGYGKHTMVNVGVFSQDTVEVTLPMIKGNTPTKWFGTLKNGKGAQSAWTNFNSQKFLGAASDDNLLPFTYTSQTTEPPYIWLAILPLDATGSPLSFTPLYRTPVDFNFYMKHVLGHEWISGWPTNALRAGAMAVKDFGWYHVLFPKYATSTGGSGAALDNSTASQVYNPYESYSDTDSAIDYLAGTGMKQWNPSDSAYEIFSTNYVAGANNNTASLCYDKNNNLINDCMTQYGSHYLAGQGETWGDILSYYYASTTLGGNSIQFFNYAPRWPSTYASLTSGTSITLSFFSASTSQYKVLKDVAGTWTTLATTTSTTYTDSSVTSSNAYTYAVQADGPGGWSPQSFNGGSMTAIASTGSNPPSPETEAFFISSSTIKISAANNVGGDQFAVYKFESPNWTLVYNNYPAVECYASNLATSTNALPPEYIDQTQSGCVNPGYFVFTDTGLTADTSYDYAVYVHKGGVWSSSTNNGGYITLQTADAY